MSYNTQMAFRARMKKRGYKEIHIKKDKKNNIWRVSGVEPLSGMRCETEMTLERMHNDFRF